MEESIKYLKEQFDLQPVDIRTYSPVVLAYIGDAVYELVIRTILVDQGNRQANTLHKKASTYVKASAQAAMAEAFLPELTEEELSYFKRGRNAKTVSMAKHATMHDYRHATGFDILRLSMFRNALCIQYLEKHFPEHASLWAISFS